MSAARRDHTWHPGLVSLLARSGRYDRKGSKLAFLTKLRAEPFEDRMKLVAQLREVYPVGLSGYAISMGQTANV